jgi:hypothetical protein
VQSSNELREKREMKEEKRESSKSRDRKYIFNCISEKRRRPKKNNLNRRDFFFCAKIEIFLETASLSIVAS